MNSARTFARSWFSFLNGVCRHERSASSWLVAIKFLNGVCRHEPDASAVLDILSFLNGVCRHEHNDD